jgi:uncharacterized phage protein (TIGR02220 family)
LKYTIEGFCQEYALTLKKTVPTRGGEKTIKIDCTDLVILRWLVDFYPNMKKMTVDGKEYVWLAHKKMLEDLPLLDITKRACIERMQKLVEFEILEYKLVKEGGTFSLYCFGKNYINLVRSTDTGAEQSTSAEGMRSNGIGAGGQPPNKDNSIIDPSITNQSIKPYNIIIDYLNSTAGTHYKATSKDTQRHINARLKEGFKLEDFKRVVDNMWIAWKGTEWEQYMRPSTLFGSKFENYLNRKPQNKGKNGVAVSIRPSDLDGVF